MRVLVPTDGEAQDVFRGRESKAELSGVVTDDLKQATQTASQTRRALRNPASQRPLNATAAFGGRRTCEGRVLGRSPAYPRAAGRI